VCLMQGGQSRAFSCYISFVFCLRFYYRSYVLKRYPPVDGR
jgi:hypothetical protein